MAQIDGREHLTLTPAEVWALLNDPDVLGRSIPGCGGFEALPEDGVYRASIAVAVGAVKGVYEGTVTYRDVQAPQRCTIAIEAGGDKGAIAGDGRLELEEAGDGTDVAYQGTFKLTGPVAGMGQRLAPGISRKLIVETLRNLERHGTAPAATSAPPRHQPPPVTAPQPPGHPPPPTAAPVAFRPFTLSPAQAFAAGVATGTVLILMIRRRR